MFCCMSDGEEQYVSKSLFWKTHENSLSKFLGRHEGVLVFWGLAVVFMYICMVNFGVLNCFWIVTVSNNIGHGHPYPTWGI